MRIDLRRAKPNLNAISPYVLILKKYVAVGKKVQAEYSKTVRAAEHAGANIPDYIQKYMQITFPARVAEIEGLLKKIEEKEKKK